MKEDAFCSFERVKFFKNFYIELEDSVIGYIIGGYDKESITAKAVTKQRECNKKYEIQTN